MKRRNCEKYIVSGTGFPQPFLGFEEESKLSVDI